MFPRCAYNLWPITHPCTLRYRYEVGEDRAGHPIDVSARAAVGRDTFANQSLVAISNFTTTSGAYPIDGAVGRLGLGFPTSVYNFEVLLSRTRCTYTSARHDGTLAATLYIG